MQVELSNNFEKKKQFLLAHEELFLRGVSFWFYLSHRQLTKYRGIIKWYNIDSNTQLKWTTEIMDEFKEEFFDADAFMNEINFNESLPWSIEFIERYEDLWNWESLAQNDAAMMVPEVKTYFYSRLYPYFELIGNDYSNNIESNAFGDRVCNSFDSDMDSFKKIKEWQFQTVEEILKAKTIDWLRLSQNELLPWSAELIEKFIDKWDWQWLSINENIPWNLELMKRFEHKIDWTKDNIKDKDGSIFIADFGISCNFCIEWDAEILSSFSDKLNNFLISESQQTKWDIDLLIQFEGFWDYNKLSTNRTLWKVVFSEFNNEELLSTLLDSVLEKRGKVK